MLNKVFLVSLSLGWSLVSFAGSDLESESCNECHSGTKKDISAVIFISTAVMHAFYLLGKRGHTFMGQIFPRRSDIKHFVQMLRYNLGFSDQRPNFGRFSFIEKFEYWALAWGSMIMFTTGIMLWFDNFFVQFLPKGVLDVMLVIHYYEAWLATLSILIWHLYSTVFNPAVYPMNPSWITGKMPIRQYEHEHPADKIEDLPD